MSRPIWTLCGLTVLAIGLAVAQRSSSADPPRPAQSVQDFSFLEIGREYDFFTISSVRVFQGKLVERLDGHWIKLEGVDRIAVPDGPPIAEPSIWWVNLDQVAGIHPTTPARGTPLRPR